MLLCVAGIDMGEPFALSRARSPLPGPPLAYLAVNNNTTHTAFVPTVHSLFVLVPLPSKHAQNRGSWHRPTQWPRGMASVHASRVTTAAIENIVPPAHASDLSPGANVTCGYPFAIDVIGKATDACINMLASKDRCRVLKTFVV